MTNQNYIICPLCGEEKEFYYEMTLIELPFGLHFLLNVCEDCIKKLKRNPDVIWSRDIPRKMEKRKRSKRKRSKK